MKLSDFLSFMILYEEYLHKKRSGKVYYELDKEIEIKDEIESLISTPENLAFYLSKISHNRDCYLNKKIDCVISDFLLLFEDVENNKKEIREIKQELKKSKRKII